MVHPDEMDHCNEKRTQQPLENDDDNLVDGNDQLVIISNHGINGLPDDQSGIANIAGDVVHDNANLERDGSSHAAVERMCHDDDNDDTAWCES